MSFGLKDLWCKSGGCCPICMQHCAYQTEAQWKLTGTCTPANVSTAVAEAVPYKVIQSGLLTGGGCVPLF